MGRHWFRLPANVVAAACLGANLAGCAHAELPDPVARVDAAREEPREEIESSDSAEGLLNYGARLRSIRAETLEQEYMRAAAAVADDSTAPNRIRLALLLSLPGASFQDHVRAKAQLEKVLGDSADETRPYHDVARFLLALLNERRQLESSLADERRQRQELQQKLEQLKAIEQDTGGRIPPKPIKEN